jgi:acyl-CoA dehydrogenase
VSLPTIWPDSDPGVLAPVAEHDDLCDVARALVALGPPPGGAVDGGRLWRALTTELDLARIAVPEELGGAGYGLRELAVVLEETGAGLVPDPVLSSAVLGSCALVLAADRPGVAELLGAVLDGDARVTVRAGVHDELDVQSAGGEDVRVSGQLLRVLHGADAGHVVARAGGDVLLVDVPAGAAQPCEVVDTTRAQADLRLDRAPGRVLLRGAAAEEGWARLTTVRDVAVAAEHTGIVGRLLDLTVDHVRTREQFGRPIGSFQAVKHRLADVLVARERCRSASRYAAARYDVDPIGARVPAVVAAAVCADAVVATAHEAVQLHGGIGFTWEHVAHRYVRRALGDEGLFGSAVQHRARLAEVLRF